MFRLEIEDQYEEVEETFSFDTLEEAIKGVREEVMQGTSTERIRLLKEIELSFIVDVKVKAE